jgi:N-acetylglutamate synthase-like GNAT family acetyltransferase
MIEIIDYSDEYANDFRQLNLEWLNKYNLAEAYDLEIISEPKRTILDHGGFIYLARAIDKIVGTAGLANEGNSVFELVKMTVAPAFQGKGIANMLIEKCLNKARELKAKKIFLYSNSQLTTAIALYKKYGFIHVDASNSPLLTADVKMELTL